MCNTLRFSVCSVVNFVVQFYLKTRENKFHILVDPKVHLVKMYIFSNFFILLYLFSATFIRKSVEPWYIQRLRYDACKSRWLIFFVNWIVRDVAIVQMSNVNWLFILECYLSASTCWPEAAAKRFFLRQVFYKDLFHKNHKS